MNYEILVNNSHRLPDNYKPQNLVKAGKIYDEVNRRFGDEDIWLEKSTYLALNEMLKCVNNLFPDSEVIADSGYRSLEKQKEIFYYYVVKEGLEKATKRVAPLGSSEHHTGLCIDIAILKNQIYDDEMIVLDKPIIWLHENCYKFGFILRYPKGKEDITGIRYEPWHFRYVGKELAKYLTLKDLTLEEYHEMLNKAENEKNKNQKLLF
jgi:D-alanyl-D-alanine carboxypeptidase